MKWIISALVCGLFLLSVSCTQPETPTAVQKAPEAAAPVVPVDTRPVIVTFGDSLSAGFGVDNGQSYPDYLQKLLDKKGYKYRVVNQGISGDTTMGGRMRTGVAIELKPAVVILELGGNDGLRGLVVKQTAENLDFMATEFQKAGAKVLIAGMTLPPNYGAPFIREFERMYSDLAARHHVPRIPFLLETVIALPGTMQSDGIHPTAKGNELVAEYVFKYLEPMLSR